MFSPELSVEHTELAEFIINNYIDHNGFFDINSATKIIVLKIEESKIAKLICEEVNKARPLLPVMVETAKRKLKGDCLSGSEIVKWIMEYYELGEEKAWELAGLAVKNNETHI